MPRSGSEVVLNHLAKAHDLECAGEFLSFHHSNPEHAFKKAFTGHFYERFGFLKVNVDSMNREMFRDFSHIEFENRIGLLRLENRGVAVKTFMSSSFYSTRHQNLNRLFDEFNMVILVRRDGLKCIISDYICRTLKQWHVHDATAQKLKGEVSSLKIEIDEHYFLGTIKSLNELKILANNGIAKVVYFEEFENDPTRRLNEILQTNVDESFQPSNRKFIDDHESHVTNLPRLKQLYDRYAIAP